MRPIALTDVSYKLFMTILGKKIDRHILENNKRMETQADFTTGSMIEDNLFTLQYCIEGCYKLKRPLIVTCLDYSKAFDSIRRGKIIEVLIHYKIHYKIIDAIANIYRNDYTEVQFGEIRREIEITSGIRQGCTGSTILFKIVTYMIMAELDRRGTGYNDEHIKIKSLFFADDALLLSHSLEEAKENLDIITDVSREFGLEINIEKSNVLIFNLKDQPEYLGNIKVVPKVKYLGIEIDNKRNYFKTQRDKIIQKAWKMANITYSVIERSCNKLLIGKTFWKSIVLPSVLYGTNIINLTEDNINELQKIENSVYRSILGAAHYSPNVTLRGEIGASLVKKRVINGRINYIKGIQSNRNKLLETILWTIETEQETKWIKTTRKYMNVTNINFNDIRLNSKEYLKQFMIKWDRNIWEDELEMKTSLQIYKKFKNDFGEEEIYDNRPSSTILYKARSNTLQLNDRNRHTNKEIHCLVCDTDDKEDIYHFMLHCTAYKEQRSQSIHLQQPYLEIDQNTVGQFLCDKENIEEKKELLFTIWKIRQHEMKRIQIK